MLNFLEEEQVREKWKLVVNASVILITTAIGLWFGTGYITKLNEEFQLSSKFIASTELSKKHGSYILKSGKSGYCEVTGQYSVTNVGSYPYTITSVSIKLWEIPYIDDDDLDQDKVTSFTLDHRLNKESKFPAIQLGETINIEVNERFGNGNAMQRSYGFIVPITEEKLIDLNSGTGSRYIIEANGFVETEKSPWYSNLDISFKDNDLRHTTETFNICEESRLN